MESGSLTWRQPQRKQIPQEVKLKTTVEKIEAYLCWGFFLQKFVELYVWLLSENTSLNWDFGGQSPNLLYTGQWDQFTDRLSILANKKSESYSSFLLHVLFGAKLQKQKTILGAQIEIFRVPVKNRCLANIVLGNQTSIGINYLWWIGSNSRVSLLISVSLLTVHFFCFFWGIFSVYELLVVFFCFSCISCKLYFQ